MPSNTKKEVRGPARRSKSPTSSTRDGRMAARAVQAVDAIAEGIYEWRIATGELWVSDRLNEIMGLKPGELTSAGWTARVHPDDVESYSAAIVGHLKGTTERLSHEYRVRRHDGAYLWIRDTARAERGRDGWATALIGGIIDISERKKANEALRQSEERYALAMRAVREGVYDWNVADDTIYYSPSVYAMLGLKESQMCTPQDWFNRIHPDDRPTYQDAIRNHFRGKTDRVEVEYRFRNAAGEWRWARQHGLGERDESGRVTRVVGATGDITDERRLAEELRAAQDRLTGAIEALAEGFALWDPEDRLVMCNSVYANWFGPAAETVTPGRRFRDIIRAGAEVGMFPEVGSDVDAWVDEVIERRAQTLGSREQHLSGDIWLQITDHKLPDGGLVSVYTDVSDIKRREAQLGELVESLAVARNEANRANEAKSRFLANMSHELRTPLNAIIGFTRIVMRRAGDALDDKQYGNLENILTSAEHLLTLINSVLDLSKIEAQRVDVSPEEIELEPFVERCLQTVQPLVDHEKIELGKDIDAGLTAIYSDPEKLRQILINLLSNAVKFTEQGSIRVNANQRGDTRIDLAVSDTGIGIPESKLSSIFDEFSQVDTSSTREHGGTGLGLAIGRRLAELLGGAIQVESREGAGTTFTVTLPLRYTGASKG